jgi:protoporphyrinogen oxidase
MVADIPALFQGEIGVRVMERVAVVGAGFAGLVAATELQRRGIDVVVFEGAPQVGGLARSFKDDEGFSHDFGAHFITNHLAEALGIAEECRDVTRHGEAVFIGGRTRWYPLGLAMDPRYALSAIRAKFTRHSGQPRTAGESFRREYGETLTREVIEPLIRGWSGQGLDDLSPATVEKLPGGVIKTVWLFLAARLTKRAVAIGYSQEEPQSARVWHVYPEGGVGSIVSKLVGELGDKVHLDSPVDRIEVVEGKVRSVRSGGVDWPVDAVLSTVPVHILPRLISGNESLEYLSQFRYRPMVFVNVRLNGRDLLATATNWFPEADTPFFRVSEATVSMPWLAPEGKTVLTADYGCDLGDEIWSMTDHDLAELTLSGLKRHIPDVRKRYLGVSVLRTPIAYPVFLNQYETDRLQFARGTGIDGLHSIGRAGEFSHILMSDIYWRTKRTVETMLAKDLNASA